MDDDEGEAVLACGDCGAAAFNLTLDGRVLCDECGTLLAPYNTRGVPLDMAVH